MGYLYRHIRLDSNEVFYIGIGGFSKNEKPDEYTRAYCEYRSKFWKNIVKKTEYKVEIIMDNLSIEEARQKEIEFINLYKRYIDGGTLCNLTLGGEGTRGIIHSKSTKEKMSIAQLGNKKGLGHKKTDECKRIIGLASKGRNVGRRPHNKLEQEKADKIIECKLSGMKNHEIMSLLNVGRTTIKRYMKLYGKKES